MKYVLSVVVLLLSCAAGVVRADTKVETLALGAPAPDFALRGVDGRLHRLRDYRRARALLVVFTCNHCPTAQAYEERIKAIVTDYRPRGVAVVAISPNDDKSVRLDELGYTDLNDSYAEMKVRAREKKFNFPYLYDGATQRVSRAYGPAATPHAFLFDAERKLRYVGRVDDSEREPLVKRRDLRDALDALLAGGEVQNRQTNSFGCSVKWAGKKEDVGRFMEKLAAEPVGVDTVSADELKALRANNETGKLRLINFWATWCGPCRTEFPDLVTINRMYRHRAFEFISVAANYPDEQKEVLAFLRQHQASNRNLLFGDTDKYKMMGAFDAKWSGALPYTVLLGPTGEVLYQVQGPIDPQEVKKTIVKNLKEDRQFR